MSNVNSQGVSAPQALNKQGCKASYLNFEASHPL